MLPLVAHDDVSDLQRALRPFSRKAEECKPRSVKKEVHHKVPEQGPKFNAYEWAGAHLNSEGSTNWSGRDLSQLLREAQ